MHHDDDTISSNENGWTYSTLHFLSRIDMAVEEAGRKMDCLDIDSDASEEEAEQIYEDRFHCGTCVVRTVMETVWPSVENYVDWLEQVALNQVSVTPPKRSWWQRRFGDKTNWYRFRNWGWWS